MQKMNIKTKEYEWAYDYAFNEVWSLIPPTLASAFIVTGQQEG